MELFLQPFATPPVDKATLIDLQVQDLDLLETLVSRCGGHFCTLSNLDLGENYHAFKKETTSRCWKTDAPMRM